jgi:hypothetical protein
LLASFQHLLLLLLFSKNARLIFVFVFVVAKAKEALVVLLPRMDARWCCALLLALLVPKTTEFF